MSIKKKEQLGMHPSTASGILVKDLLWSFIVKDKLNICHHCNLKMTREDFSIEHKTPWLDSESPKELFFNIENIAFSHLVCNIKASRKPLKKYFDTESRRKATAKLQKDSWNRLSLDEKKALRKLKYEKYNC